MNTNPALPARHRAQLIASHLTTDRGGQRILTDVDVTLSAGSRWGIVGENGRGKSTLLQILAGNLNPDSGTVQRIGTIAVVEQEMDFRTDRTVGQVIDDHLAKSRAALHALDQSADALARDAPGAADLYSAALDAAQALDAWDAERRIDLALDRLGASTERRRPLSSLSIGQRYRVRLACVLGEDADFLLLDEPTNHLDAAGLEYLTSRLRDHSGGVAVVSHDRALLAAVATTILDLDPSRDGLPRSYGGGFEAYRAGREAELVRWEADYDQQVAERRKLTQDLSEAQNRLSTGWKPDKGTPRHQRQTRAPGIVRSVNRRRDELDRHIITAPVPPPRFRMPDLGSRPGMALLIADGIRVEGRLHEPVDVSLESGSRLVVTGPNGAGKSTLLAVLAGRLSPTGGLVRTGHSARVELLAQESPEAIRGGRPMSMPRTSRGWLPGGGWPRTR